MASIRKRTRKDGSASYRAEIRMKGHPPESKTFPRLTDAKKWVQDTESAIRDGRYFKTRESQRHTLAELIDTFIEDKLPDKKTGAKTAMQLQWWKGELGHLVLADVTPGRITGGKKKLLAGMTNRGGQRSPSTVNRYLAALSICLSYGVRDLGWLEDSPARKVQKNTESRGRIRFLSDDERTRLLKACKESSNLNLYPIVVLALSTGMRQGEILNLSWQVVDLKLCRITLYETKNGEIRVVPLAGYALDLLREHARVRPIDTDLLFPARYKRNIPGDIRRAWLIAIEMAEIEDFRFHDLRHSAASYLAMNGASMPEIAEILGHKTLQMVKRYSHLSETHTASVVESMNSKIFGEQG